jgi:hypothetical protein
VINPAPTVSTAIGLPSAVRARRGLTY